MAHESILIVEDEPLAARFVQILLERLHYAVCGTAATGQDAIAMVKAEKPDLVLMDIALKGAIDGIETTRELRKFHDIPVVFLTAFSDLETLERAKQTEPYGFLVKPFKAEDLASVVRVALTKHAMDRQLRQSHKRYMTLVQNISDGVLLYKANGSLQLCNRQASELTGIGERQLFTENCVELDWNAVDERGRPLESRNVPIVQAILRGTAVRHAVLGFPRQGSADRTWVIVNVEPTRSSSTGEPEFLATITDITTLAGAEKALVDTRALSDTIVSNFPNGVIALFDRDLRYLLIDGLELEALGLDKVQMIGKTIRELLPEDTCAIVAAAIRRSFSGEFVETDLEFRERHYRMMTLPVSDSSGKVSAVLGMSQNITERKQMLDALRSVNEELEVRVEQRTRELQDAFDAIEREAADREKAREALRESEERFRAVFHSSHDGIIVCDLEGRIIFINDAAASDFRGSAKSLLGTDLRAAETLSRGLWEKAMAAASDDSAGRSPVFLEWSSSVNGQRRSLEIRAFPIANDSGLTFAVCIMMRDITARKEAEKILELERHLGITLNTVTEMKDICRTVFDVVLQLDGVDWAAVYLVDEKEGGIELLDHRNLPTEFAKLVARFGNDAPQSQRARAQSPTCFRASEATRETRVLYESEGVHAVAVFPIRFENHPVASLSVASKTRDGFPPFVQKALESVAVQLGGSFARANTLDALRRSEARYRGVVESQGELIFRCDDAGRFTFVNDAMCRTFGRDVAEMIGSAADVYAYDDDLPTLIVHFEKLLEAPHRVTFETRARTAAGPRWFRWEACAFLDGQRKLVEVQTVGRDVTELKRENERNLIFSLALQNTSDLVVIASESGHVWFANKACLSTLGCAGTAVQDMPLNEFISGLSPDQFEEMRRSTRQGGWNGTVQYRRPDGENRHITIATSTIFGLDGNIFGFLGLGRDITEMRDHEERDNENRMYEAFGRMASMVSHEIKTPLTSIKMNFDMLRGDLEEDARSAPSFAIISQELTRLQNLVQRSLDIGSFGRMTKEKVELRALFDEILATFGVQLQNRKLSCDIDIPRCSMLADREKLRAAISNLVNNAIDAAGPEGRIRVTGALHPDGTRIDCSVTDNGPGIPGTVNVFQPFYTTKTGGTGLGLPNARRIFEQHGGTLTLESSEPGKTVFAFSLPLEAVS